MDVPYCDQLKSDVHPAEIMALFMHRSEFLIDIRDESEHSMGDTFFVCLGCAQQLR